MIGRKPPVAAIYCLEEMRGLCDVYSLELVTRRPYDHRLTTATPTYRRKNHIIELVPSAHSPEYFDAPFETSLAEHATSANGVASRVKLRPHHTIYDNNRQFFKLYPPTRGSSRIKTQAHRKRPVRISVTIPRTTPEPFEEVAVPERIQLISKLRHKFEDRAISQPLTVVDYDFPVPSSNFTEMQSDKLVIAIRQGKPSKRHPTTTPFPVYNIVAGITPPLSISMQNVTEASPAPMSNETTSEEINLSNLGEASTESSQSASFGSPNIKLPAADEVILESVGAQPERVSIKVSGSTNLADPSKVPDKILVETSATNIVQPPSRIIGSNTTIVNGPADGANTIIRNGIIRIGTTVKPKIGFSTTESAHIELANATVIGVNSNQNTNQALQLNPHNSALVDTVVRLINAGAATSQFAVLTLLRVLILVVLAILLSPIALTAFVGQFFVMG